MHTSCTLPSTRIFWRLFNLNFETDLWNFRQTFRIVPAFFNLAQFRHLWIPAVHIRIVNQIWRIQTETIDGHVGLIFEERRQEQIGKWNISTSGKEKSWNWKRRWDTSYSFRLCTIEQPMWTLDSLFVDPSDLGSTRNGISSLTKIYICSPNDKDKFAPSLWGG